jgi:hypothetical protein
MNRPGIGHSAQQVFANAPGAAVSGRVAGGGQCAGVADKVALWKQILRFRDARNAAGTDGPVTQEAAGQAPSRGTWAAVFAQLTGAARSEQVAQRSTDAILVGVLAPGDRLSSEAEPAKRFGAALVTARDGLGAVREAVLVETGADASAAALSLPPSRRRRGPCVPGCADSRRSRLPTSPSILALGAGCAERAAELASTDEAERLTDWLRDADFESPSSASRRGWCASRYAFRPSLAPCCGCA